MKIGIQREVWKNAVLTADYVRNVSLHYLLGVDTNHVGDSRFLNKTAAANAIAATLGNCGVASINAGLQPQACHFDPVTGKALASSKFRSLTIDDFANNGVDSGNTLFGGVPAEGFGVNPLTDTGAAAFPGINPWYGANTMLFPNGRSVYNGLLVSLKQRRTNLLKFVPGATLQVSYALSRFSSMAGDQDFINNATDFANPNRFFGPASFDRTHQFSFGTVFTLPKGLQVSFIGHFDSPLPTTLFMEDLARPGEIFHTDVTGDGTTGDILPGQNIGSFMRGVSPSGLNGVITAYNGSQAGKITPAGQALITAGLFTQQQLISLGAVTDTVSLAPKGEVGNDWLRIFDAKFAYPIKIRERLTIESSIGLYNMFNFANFGISPGNRLSGILSGSAGSVNGTTYNDQGNRAGLGSGVFQSGAPRQIEFGLRFVF